jgi:hypothetical protein
LPPVLVIVWRPAMLDSVEQRRAAMRQMRKWQITRRSGVSFFHLSFFLEIEKWETRPTRTRRVRIFVRGSRLSEAQDSVRGLPRKKERRWPWHRVACLRRCERRKARGRKDPEFHKRRALYDAWRQTPVDVASDGTAIMIPGSEGRAVSCGGGLGCLCFFTLMGAAVVPRRGRFRLMGR